MINNMAFQQYFAHNYEPYYFGYHIVTGLPVYFIKVVCDLSSIND